MAPTDSDGLRTGSAGFQAVHVPHHGDGRIIPANRSQYRTIRGDGLDVPGLTGMQRQRQSDLPDGAATQIEPPGLSILVRESDDLIAAPLQLKDTDAGMVAAQRSLTDLVCGGGARLSSTA